MFSKFSGPIKKLTKVKQFLFFQYANLNEHLHVLFLEDMNKIIIKS